MSNNNVTVLADITGTMEETEAHMRAAAERADPMSALGMAIVIAIDRPIWHLMVSRSDLLDARDMCRALGNAFASAAANAWRNYAIAAIDDGANDEDINQLYAQGIGNIAATMQAMAMQSRGMFATQLAQARAARSADEQRT